MASTPPAAGSSSEPPGLHAVQSAGGLAIRLPEGWHELEAGEHLAVFVGDDPATVRNRFAPNCVLTELPGHIPFSRWWQDLQTSTDGPLLLEAGQDDSGFAATFAQVADGISITGFARAFLVPGRTVTITVQFATSEVARLLPLAAWIADSLEVEGLA